MILKLHFRFRGCSLHSRLPKLFCDNSAVVSFSKNTRNTYRSNHIDVKFFFVKEKVAEFS